MREIAKWLREHDDFALVGHVSPDGDSYGSCLTLCMAMRNMGKRAFVAAPVPPQMYGFLPGQELIYQAENMPFAPRSVVHLDISSLDRIGVELPEGLEAALIDHHDTNPGFDDVCWIDGKACSTGEMVYQILKEMNAEVTPDMAVCLYTALATDTNNFQFSSTTPIALRAAAELVENGLDIGKYSALLFRSRTLARTQLLGEALHAMRISHGGKIAMTVVTREMMEKCNATHADTEGIVNYLNEIRGVEAAAMIEEREGSVKASLRSAEKVDVAAVAHSLGGGGHKFAAGVTIFAPVDEAFAILEQKLQEAVG